MLVAALQVQALPIGLRQGPYRDQIDDHADQRHGQHEGSANVGRIEQAADRLVGDECRQDQQGHAVGLGGEDLHALEAKGHGAPGRTGRQAQREQREADRGGVGEHVRRVGEQRQRVRDHTGRDLHGHERQDQAERDRQLAAVGVGGRCVGVPGVVVGHQPTIRSIPTELKSAAAVVLARTVVREAPSL